MLNAYQLACWVQHLGLTIGLSIEKGLKQVWRWKQDDLSDLSLFVGQSAGDTDVHQFWLLPCSLSLY